MPRSLDSSDRSEPVGHCGKDLVATGMTEAVIDRLELVQIDERQRTNPGAGRGSERTVEFVTKMSPVAKGCDRIKQCHRRCTLEIAADLIEHSVECDGEQRERLTNGQRSRT